MKIDSTTTLLDLAFNVSGSLAGLPNVLSQLPDGPRVGFDSVPKVWEDVPVECYGQTWTPELAGLDVAITSEVYNTEAYNKAPYSTNMQQFAIASQLGSDLLKQQQPWYESLEVGALSITDGTPYPAPYLLRSSVFSDIEAESYYIGARDGGPAGTMLLYSDTFEFIDYWSIGTDKHRTVSTVGARYFKVVIYASTYNNSFTIKPVF